MYFEVTEQDVLGRIGRLETKSGKLETPALLPVVNPLVQEISPRTMLERFGCKALITNAYLIRRRHARNSIADIHVFLNFPGIIATDSGAYQILRYGDVEISSSEVVEYEQSIQTDIGVILDVPTGSRASRSRAMETVSETIKRADEAQKTFKRNDIRWVGPIQGGLYLDLVAFSAKEMSKRSFDIHAIGSPTEVMEQYLFSDLVDMILSAKMHLPSNRPLHLFGAGHPFMLSLAVASGCDLFDSAAYILYARRNRYLTQGGTLQLGQMSYFPCKCSSCANADPAEVRSRSTVERIRFLAEHNLTVCMQEIDSIKEAINEGRLWELVEMRSRGHPALLEGFLRFREYKKQLASRSPSTKRKGILFFDSASLSRPEYYTQFEQVLCRYSPPRESKILLLKPSPHQASKHTVSSGEPMDGLPKGVHLCYYLSPYGVIPSELKDTFPFSHTEAPENPDRETLKAMSEFVRAYLARNKNYGMLVFLHSGKEWQARFSKMCKRICKTTRMRFHTEVADEIAAGRMEMTASENRFQPHSRDKDTRGAARTAN